MVSKPYQRLKVTELVLNAGTARLGQAMRETQDSLVRDELEATASVVNCVGKTYTADVKPTLIDMEARWGDMAQAKAA